jgi:ubiquitin C-terminal hydrolase
MTETLIKFNNNLLLYPFGLYNNSIICYFNSLLQALYGCTSITEYLLNNKGKFKNNTFVKLYINIIEKYISIDTKENHIDKNNLMLFNEFLHLLKNKNIKFGYNQEDAGELLVLLLDIINDKHIYNLFYHKYSCDIYCKKCKNIKNINNDLSIQFEIDNKTMNENFLSYKVDTNLHNINKYIRNNYCQLDSYLCNKCNLSNYNIKINRLTLIPTIIVINFNKYLNKVDINYPNELYFINKLINKKYYYKLVSTIHHSGNMNYGHYYTKSIRKDVNNNDENVYLINDTSYDINNFKPDSLTYILFYHYIESLDYFIE